jgi:SAM-dependent methyltransferase
MTAADTQSPTQLTVENTLDTSASTTDDLVERLFKAAIGALEVASIHIGGHLGFYSALSDGGPVTSTELASRTGTAERYAREWLEQQAVAGFLSVDTPAAEPTDRRYALPEAHRPVFVDEEDLNYITPLATLVVGALEPMERLLDTYRSGGGIPYEAYGAGFAAAIGAMNRPQFVNQMAEWLGAIPEIDQRLGARPAARVADVGCGTAWSSIALARAYPKITVDAIDVDLESVEIARRNVDAAGLSERVRPMVHDASDPDLGGNYDVVTIFEALHDMNHPVEALRAVLKSLNPGGSVVVADERVAEQFTAPGDDIERANYGFSILHCLTVGLLDEDSAGTGTVMRPETVHAYASQAGFGEVTVLDIDHDFWRFYRLIP